MLWYEPVRRTPIGDTAAISATPLTRERFPCGRYLGCRLHIQGGDALGARCVCGPEGHAPAGSEGAEAARQIGGWWVDGPTRLADGAERAAATEPPDHQSRAWIAGFCPLAINSRQDRLHVAGGI